MSVKDWIKPGAIIPVTVDSVRELVDALRQAIEQAEQCPHGVDDGACKECYSETQEPVGYAHAEDLKQKHQDFLVNREQGVNEVPLYAAPPQRKWVGLTDADIAQTMRGNVEGSNMLPYQFARAIESKLREKNA